MPRRRRRRPSPLGWFALGAFSALAGAALLASWPREPALPPPAPPEPPPPRPRAPAEESGPRLACTFAFVRPARVPEPPAWSARVVGDDLVHAAYSVRRALENA